MMPSLWRTSRLRRSPASWRSPSLIMSSTPLTEVGCMGLRLTFLLILCSCVQILTGLTWHHQKGKTLQLLSHTFPSSSFKYSCPASVTLTSAPIGTAEPESNHTKSPFIDTASGVTSKGGSLGGWQKGNNHSYLDQMQHFGNLDQVCRDERAFMLSERCSHNRDQNFLSHSNWNGKPVASEHQRSDRLSQVLFLTSDFQTLQPSSCRAIFCLAVSEAGSFPKQTPLYDSLTLLLLEGHPKSQCYQSIKRLYHQHQLLGNYTCRLQLTDTVIEPSNRHLVI